MPFLLFGVSFAITFVVAAVLISSDSGEKPSKPVLKGIIAGLVMSALQFLLLVAGSKGEGGLLAPIVGMMLLPPALLGGIAAGLVCGGRGRYEK